MLQHYKWGFMSIVHGCLDRLIETVSTRHTECYVYRKYKDVTKCKGLFYEEWGRAGACTGFRLDGAMFANFQI